MRSFSFRPKETARFDWAPADVPAEIHVEPRLSNDYHKLYPAITDQQVSRLAEILTEYM